LDARCAARTTPGDLCYAWSIQIKTLAPVCLSADAAVRRACLEYGYTTVAMGKVIKEGIVE
jgi:hypothetical protein